MVWILLKEASSVQFSSLHEFWTEMILSHYEHNTTVFGFELVDGPNPNLRRVCITHVVM
jgi:hypothetical protein